MVARTKHLDSIGPVELDHSHLYIRSVMLSSHTHLVTLPSLYNFCRKGGGPGGGTEWGELRKGNAHTLKESYRTVLGGKPPTSVSYSTAYAGFMLSPLHLLSCEVHLITLLLSCEVQLTHWGPERE